MKKSLLNYCGLLGVVSLLSYSIAVIFSPLAYPGYEWMRQAVSDLSVQTHHHLPYGINLVAFIMFVKY